MMKSSSRSMLRAQINSTLDRCCVGNHESGMCSLLPSERPGVLAVGSEMLEWDLQGLVLFRAHLEMCCPSGTVQGSPRQSPGRHMGLKDDRCVNLSR